MSIITKDGKPIAHDFNNIDGVKLLQSNPDYVEISDEEFEKRFEIVMADNTLIWREHYGKSGNRKM